MSKRPKVKPETRNVKLVLASSSPRRAELLRNARIAFTSFPAEAPEARQPQEWPEDFVRRVAGKKPAALLAMQTSTCWGPTRW